MLRHFHLHLGQFGLNIGDILLHLINIHQFFFLEGIHIPRNIQVEVVLLDLVEGGHIAILILVLSCLIGVDNAGNIAVPQDVLVLTLFEVPIPRGVDEQYIPCGFS